MRALRVALCCLTVVACLALAPRQTLAVAESQGVDPEVTAPVHHLIAEGRLTTSGVLVRLTWTGTGAERYRLQKRIDGDVWQRLWPGQATEFIVRLAPGHTYQFRVQGVDATGTLSAWAEGNQFTLTLNQETDIYIDYNPIWRTATGSHFSGGQARYASGAQAWASYQFVGNSVAWVAQRGRGRGIAQVYVDATLIETVNLYAPSLVARPLVFAFNGLDEGEHVIDIIVTGDRDPAATGQRVDLDAFVVLD